VEAELHPVTLAWCLQKLWSLPPQEKP